MERDPIQEAVALLRQRRAELARLLAEVDEGIDRLLGGGASASEPPPQARAKSLRDQILDAMPEARTYSADEIVAAVEGQEASVRSILSRLTRNGDLVSQGRGRYARPRLIPLAVAENGGDQVDNNRERAGG